MKSDVQKYTGSGKCEAGLPISNRLVERLPYYCDKRARWIVGGALLCGGCKRKVVG